jgi:hypothetical protein
MRPRRRVPLKLINQNEHSSRRQGQYRLRERAGPSVNLDVECLTHPLTQVVLTSFRFQNLTTKATHLR